MSFTPRTIAQAIEDAAKADPTRGYRFFADSGIPGFLPPGAEGSAEATFSYTAVERMSGRFGGSLQALGLRKGDRVALILPNNDDFVLCFLGALRAGIVPVPIYPPMALGQLQAYLDNTRHIVHKAGARALVTTSKIKRLLGTVQSECPDLEQVVAIEGIRESTEPLKPERVTLEDVAFLQFTSGSTSRPKGVTLTHANLAANIRCIGEHGLRLTNEDVAVSWLPLYHDMGLIGFVLTPLFHRVPVHFLPALTFLKRPVTWLQAFTRVGGTIAYAPNFAYALCVKRIKAADLEGLSLERWRVAGCGAEPIRPETLEAFGDTFSRIGFKREAFLPSYGMAESSLAIAFTELGEGMKTIAVHGPTLWDSGQVRTVGDDDENAVRLVSCGPQFPEHEVRVFAPEDATSATPLVADVVGELRIRGPSVMRGYWEDAERTRDSFAGPWLRTGDLGFLHDEHVFICGRSKEVVIVNGRNYYPQDMEWEASKDRRRAKRQRGGLRRARPQRPGARPRACGACLRGAGARTPGRPHGPLDRGAQGRAGGHGPHARRRRGIATRCPSQDVKRKAAAGQDARAVRDRRADGAHSGPRRDQARPREARRPEPAQLLQARGPGRAQEEGLTGLSSAGAPRLEGLAL